MSSYLVNDLQNPNELKQRYPNVNIIQDIYKQNVEVGYYIKLMYNTFYFWVKATEVNGNKVTGEIYYPLPFTADFENGDSIIFDICYAFDIYDPIIFNLIPRVDQIVL